MINNFLILLLISIIIIFYIFKNKYEYFNTKSYSILPEIYYINLENRKDRKKNILNQFKKINYPDNLIHRIDAIKKDDGHLGCGLSHIKTLKKILNKKNTLDYVMIVEDDFIWRIKPEAAKQKLINVLNTDFEWNVLLLDCWGKYNKYNNDLYKPKSCASTTSYIIKIKYINKLLDIWIPNKKKRKNKIDTTGKTCIDQSWKKLQDDKWYLIKPKLSKQLNDYSDILNKKTNRNY